MTSTDAATAMSDVVASQETSAPAPSPAVDADKQEMPASSSAPADDVAVSEPKAAESKSEAAGGGYPLQGQQQQVLVDVRAQESCRVASNSVLRFGVLSDIQYANIDTRAGRDYRGTLPVLEKAVAYFNAVEEPLQFVIHLGDIVDDQNSKVDDGATTMAALSSVLKQLRRLHSPGAIIDPIVKFLLGNHEMYNFSRRQLIEGVTTEFGMFKCADASGNTYYSWSPTPKWRMVVLDPYAESIFAEGRGSGLEEKATQFICEHNANVRAKMEKDGEEARRLGTIQCNYFQGISGVARRLNPFNGGLGAKQLEWLAGEFQEANKCGQRVVLLSHVLFHPEATRSPAGNEDGCFGKTLIWDYEQILQLLNSPEGRCVVACFHGHQHEGGFHTDEHGIHHIVFESLLFGPAYAITEFTDESLILRGFAQDRMPSLVFPDSSHGKECCRVLPLRVQRTS